VKKDSPQGSADEVLATLPEGTRFYVLFPLFDDGLAPAAKKKPRARSKAAKQDELSLQARLISLLQQGFSRLYRGGEVIELKQPEDFPFDDLHDTFVLIDRLKASEDVRSRLIDSLETCFHEAHAGVIETTDGERLKYSDSFVCKYDGTRYEEPEPALFGFNSPYGACPTCQGFGNTIGVDYDLVIPNHNLSLKEGAVDPFTRPTNAWAQKELLKYAAAANIDVNAAFADLPDFQQNCIIYGDEGWRGIKGFFEWLETKKYKLHVRVFLAKYRGYTRCPDCNGQRLRQEARDVKIGGRSLPDIIELSVADAHKFFDELTLSEERMQIADKLLLEIRRRLAFLVNVGL